MYFKYLRNMLIHTKQVFRGKYFSASAAVNWQEVYFFVVYYKINFESDNFGDTSKNVTYRRFSNG